MNRRHIALPDQVRQTIRSRRFRYVILALYVLTLLFLSLNPWLRPASTGALLSPDKLDHAFAYGGLAIILFLCFKTTVINPGRAWIAALLTAIAVGILIEFAQTMLTHHRSGSFADAAANAIGAGLGYMAFRLFEFVAHD